MLKSDSDDDKIVMSFPVMTMQKFYNDLDYELYIFLNFSMIEYYIEFRCDSIIDTKVNQFHVYKNTSAC